MRNKPVVALTELPPNPEQEQHARMLRYGLAMGIRTICVLLIVVTPGWWVLLPAAGAVFLPYIAVVIANAAHRGPGATVLRPGALVPRDGP